MWISSNLFNIFREKKTTPGDKIGDKLSNKFDKARNNGCCKN